MKNVDFRFGLSDTVYFMDCNKIVSGEIKGSELPESYYISGLVLYKVKVESKNTSTIRTISEEWLYEDIDQLLINLKFKYENAVKTT